MYALVPDIWLRVTWLSPHLILQMLGFSEIWFYRQMTSLTFPSTKPLWSCVLKAFNKGSGWGVRHCWKIRWSIPHFVWLSHCRNPVCGQNKHFTSFCRDLISWPQVTIFGNSFYQFTWVVLFVPSYLQPALVDSVLVSLCVYPGQQ